MPPATAVLAEALRKATVCWLEAPGRGGGVERPVPIWFGLHGGRVYVLGGGDEQRLPDIRDAAFVHLLARSKDAQALIARVPARVRVVPGDDPLFDEVVGVLLPRRLNLPDGEAAAERWRRESTLFELTPVEPSAP